MSDPMTPAMPSDLQAERAVLASMLLDPDCIPLVLSKARAADFYDPRHALVFECIAEVDAARSHVDVLTVVAALRSRDRLNTVGGAQFVGELTDEIPTVAHVESHIALVANLAAVRHAIDRMGELVAMARVGHHDPRDLALKLGRLALEMTRADAGRTAIGVREVLLDLFQGVGEEPAGAIDWPWPALTAKFGPLLPSECVLVSAEPATGKSALVLMLAIHAAKAGKHVLFFSFEMSREEIGRRMLAQESGVTEAKMLGRVRMEGNDSREMNEAGRRLADLPLHISDDPSVTLLRLRAEIQFAKVTRGCDVVVVDYLQLVARDDGDDKNETQRLETLSRGLKAMAMEFRVVMLVVSSLNDTKGQKGAPVMGNLRGSRSLGVDANKIFMLYTEDEIDEENPPPVMEVKIKARKNRGGQRNATHAMRFEGALYRFSMPEDYDDFGERVTPAAWTPARPADPTPAADARDDLGDQWESGEGLPGVDDAVFHGQTGDFGFD